MELSSGQPVYNFKTSDIKWKIKQSENDFLFFLFDNNVETVFQFLGG